MQPTERDPLTHLPDIRYMMMLHPPWELALKARSNDAWNTVAPLLGMLRGSRPPFKQFAEWAICVLSLAMLEAGDAIISEAVIRQIEEQGDTLIKCSSLSESTRKSLEMLHQHPQEHFMAMMTEAVAKLSGSLAPSDDEGE